MLIFGLVLGYFLTKLSPVRGTWFSFLMFGLLILINYLFFSCFKIWVNLIYPVLTVILVSMGTITFKFFTEEKEKRQIKGAFKHYLSPILVEELAKNPETLRLGGGRKELTVMFSDVRNFTSISEGLSPEQLVNVINTYLSSMTKIILAHNGLVDKFIGDAIMAIFGAPLPFEEHPQLACISAIEMIKELNRLRPVWQERGFPDIKIGLGINTGLMVIGNMGSEERFDYTVLGDSVNLASRLEGLNKVYGSQIIVSEFTAARLKGILLRELDRVRVKGKEQPIKIYEVIGREGEEMIWPVREQKIYREALDLYAHQQWLAALKAFNSLAGGTETKLYSLYRSRCRQFLETPPAEDWDGVCVFNSK